MAAPVSRLPAVPLVARWLPMPAQVPAEVAAQATVRMHAPGPVDARLCRVSVPIRPIPAGSPA